MNAQRVEGDGPTPMYDCEVRDGEAYRMTSGLYTYASQAWDELLEYRLQAEQAVFGPDGEPSMHMSRMWAIVGVLDLLESGQPEWPDNWRYLLMSEFGVQSDGVGELVLPDPDDPEHSLTYRVRAV